jgi:hypothetical protein
LDGCRILRDKTGNIINCTEGLTIEQKKIATEMLKDFTDIVALNR